MRYLVLDLETTGFDPVENNITEIGYLIRDTEMSNILHFGQNYIDPPDEISQEITDITGITRELTKEMGVPAGQAFIQIMEDVKDYNVDYIVAHNGSGFDKNFLLTCIRKVKMIENMYKDFVLTPWLDTQHDIEWPEDFKSNSLEYCCMKMDFIHSDAHSAMIDTMATDKMLLRAIRRGITSFDQMIAYSKEPWVYVESDAKFHQKDAAKKLRYRWETVDDVTVPKRWINKFKESKLTAAKAAAIASGFSIRKIQDESKSI